MAYNPFNIFRRNQKAIFAVITVFIMFTFVLSSGMMGGADFFDWFPNWLRGKTQKGEHLCTIDGTKVFAADIERVRKARITANKFMELASIQARLGLQQYVDDSLGRASPNRVQMFRNILELQSSNYIPPQLKFLANQLPLERLLQMREETIRSVQFELTQLSNDEKASSGDRDIARALLLGMMMDRQRSTTSPDLYFTNAPNRGSTDVVNFMLWEKKADQLGIKFTEADVRSLIQREFYGQFRDDVAVRKQMSQSQGFNLDSCIKAIGVEFKVRAAQSVLLGAGGERSLVAPPVFTPPYDLFAFYREQCSPTTYEVLALPVEAFIPAVPVPPDTDRKFEDELRELFTKYQSAEPNPASETPGFMEPRKIKLDWLKATGAEKYFQDAARQRLTTAAAVLELLPAALSGWPAVASAAAAQLDPLVNQLYEREWAGLHRVNADMLKDTHRTVRMASVLDTSVARPANIGAALLGMGGGLAGFVPPAAAVAPVAGGTIAFEVRDRVRSGMAAFLGAVPGPGMLGTMVTGEAAHRATLPRPLPLDLVRADVLRTLSEREARKVMVADLTKLRTDVDKIFKEAKPDAKGRAEATAKAKALIDEFVKTRGLQKGESTGLRTEWTIEDDPGLAPLKAVWEKARPIHGPLPVPFGRALFWEADRLTGRRPVSGLHRPEFYPDRPNPSVLPYAEPDPVFVTWRTEEKPPRQVAFNEAKPEVKAAWVRMKARELAKTRADTIAKQIRDGTATSLFEIEHLLRDKQYEVMKLTTDPKVQDKVKEFKLLDVAPLATAGQADISMMMMPGGLRPFHLEPSANIPYPTREMEKALLDERTKGVRTTLVLPDQPKDTYYVAVVADRQVKTDDDFARSVYGEGMMSGAREIVRAQFRQESGKKAYDSVLALLKQEFKYTASEEQQKKLEKGDREGD
jgi:hypothetical protein